MDGLILAGGKAVRMGGGDKPLRRFGQGVLLDHVVARVGPQVTRLAISANGDPARFAGWGCAVVADAVPGQGPLGGMLAGLRWAAGAESLLIVPGDTPFLPEDLAARLAAAGAPAAYAVSGGRDHPTVALVATRLADDLAAYLASGQRAVRGWMARQGAVGVIWPVTPRDPFFNINTPEALAAALG